MGARRRQRAAGGDRRRGAHGVFTSDLSVSEYVLLGEAGFEPLGFVVGSSIYHIGIQVARWGQNQELTVLTQAMYTARELAMSRMQAEAEQLGADGIVGVNLRLQQLRLGPGRPRVHRHRHRRARARGSGAHRAPDGRAFSSDLSAQDFYRLLAAGAVPVAFVLGTCVYHIAHQSGDAVAAPGRRKPGDGDLHPGHLRGPRARRWHGCRPRRPRRGRPASSACRVEVHNHVWGEHATEFFATGTAIRQLDPSHHMPDTAPKPTFTLGLDR